MNVDNISAFSNPESLGVRLGIIVCKVFLNFINISGFGFLTDLIRFISINPVVNSKGNDTEVADDVSIRKTTTQKFRTVNFSHKKIDCKG